MAGLLAGLAVIEKMEQVTGVQTTLEIACDNNEALRVASFYHYFNARMKHYDMVRALIGTRKTIKSQIKATQVLGHADEKITDRALSRVEVLNVSCDRLAKMTRTSVDRHEPIRLPREGLSLWHGKTKVYNNIQDHVSHIFYHKRAKQKLMEKYAWSEE